MNHWPFILAAYALTLGASFGVTLLSYLSMRRAERALSALERDQ